MILQAGAARAIITPPVGLELSGMAFGPSVGILDDLEAQALVLESAEGPAVLITADLIGLRAESVAAVRAQIEAAFGIPGERVLIAGSHTHSGPATVFLRCWGTCDEGYLRVLEAQMVGLVGVARRSLRPAQLRVGLGQVNNISENRRVSGGVIDPAVPVLRLDDTEGRPLAVLYNFACHPVSLHSYRNLISPDYPGYARDAIRRIMGPDVVVLFTLGAAGDINPQGYVARQTTPQRSWQIGTILGCEVIKTALAAQPQEPAPLRVQQHQVELPVEPLPSPAELRELQARCAEQIARREATGRPVGDGLVPEITYEWAGEALQAWERQATPRSRTCVLQGIRLGETALLALPLEVFVETGLAIKHASPARLTVISSNANGALGYLPTRQAYETTGDYTNPRGLAPKVYDLYAFSAEAEPLVRQEALRLLKALY